MLPGVDDSVRCYHCGGGLRNWAEGDSPILEHANWYPNCTHVLLIFGRPNIDELKKKRQHEQLDSLNVIVSLHEYTYILYAFSHSLETHVVFR